MNNTMTVADLRNFIIAIKGATPVGLTYEAPVKMLKTGNPYADDLVVKTQNLSGMINVNYENSVNRQLGREDKPADFQAQARTWGEHESAAIVVSAKGDYSLVMQPVNTPSEVAYTRNGQPIEFALIEPFLPKKSPSKTQGTDKEVANISLRLDRIKSINVKGETITLA